ncbi:MAG TPA: hypothetical protein VHA37_09625 [Candidatus Saccharimonadales bacterium]|nr:hypothetical protein [Candidatus Saccharimonadales bacterium]
MIWVRKGVVWLLSLLLLGSLLGTALATTANHTLAKPKKVESMLAQSKLYDHFVAYLADQAKKSEGDTDMSGSVSLNDAAVLSAAQSAFPSSLIGQSINTFINSNYDWLEGKTATPQFKIDLTSQKATFAQKVGQYVKNYSAGLPVCSDAQALQEIDGDPLAATCRPSGVTPDTIGAQVSERLATTSDFLSNPVITANSVNPNGNPESQPYYQKLAHLPQLYRTITKLPYIFGALSLLSALGIVFIALSRRRGLRRVGVVLAVAGVLLVLSNVFANIAVDKLAQHVFNSSSVGLLQQSLTNFAHRVASALVRINVWFGAAYLVLAAVVLGLLLKTRQKPPKAAVAGGPDVAGGGDATDSKGKGALPRFAKRRLGNRRSAEDSIMPLGAQPGGEGGEAEAEAPAPPPKRRQKPPRLIQ